MEADAVTFEERSSKMETTDLDGNQGATEAIVERQELCKRFVVRRRRWAKKQTQNSIGSQYKLSVVDDFFAVHA
jgi:hypothetical protein